MNKLTDNTLLAAYENALQEAREAIKVKVGEIVRVSSDPVFSHRYLIAFCAQGVHMTQPVPDWI